MFKKMLIRGTILVGGLIATQAVLEKLERAELKRTKKVIELDSEEKDEVRITEEELRQTFEDAIEMADKMEADGIRIYK